LTWIKQQPVQVCETERMKRMAALSVSDLRAAAKPKARSAAFTSKRLDHEWKTMAAMIRIHCRDHHPTTAALCEECQGLLDYSAGRLEHCRFGEEKPTCAKCPVHCYQRARRDQAKAVMRYAGPRMLWEHPIMSLRHWLDGFRTAPAF
jgi:hypothetical protein